MKSITIKAITTKGKAALEQHFQESQKLRIVHRLTFKKMGFRQEIISDDPHTLEISITNPYFQSVMQKGQMLKEVHKALKKNGADKNKDYQVQVK